MPSSSYPAEFQTAVSRLLRDEGGYVDNPSDPGGATKYGISRRSYPDLDIEHLTRDDAIAIYYRDWWLKYGFARLPNEIATKVFDLAVNMGAHSAVACLQRALRACGNPVTEDGVVGELTADAARTVEMHARTTPLSPFPTPLMAALRSEAAAHYRLCAAAADASDNSSFLKGWLRRAYE